MDDTDAVDYARAPAPEDLVGICRALNKAGARYVLIGGFAVFAHGASRFTKDLDLLVDDAPDNIARVKRGLAILADNIAAEVADHDGREHTVVRSVDELIVDGMGRACGLDYAEVAADMAWIELSGVRVLASSRRRRSRRTSTRRARCRQRAPDDACREKECGAAPAP